MFGGALVRLVARRVHRAVTRMQGPERFVTFPGAQLAATPMSGGRDLTVPSVPYSIDSGTGPHLARASGDALSHRTSDIGQDARDFVYFGLHRSGANERAQKEAPGGTHGTLTHIAEPGAPGG